MQNKQRVLIVEAREALREGLHSILVKMSCLVDEATTFNVLLQKLADRSWDLILIHQSLVTDINLLPSGHFAILAPCLDINILFAARLHGGRAYLAEYPDTSLLQQVLSLLPGTFLTDPITSRWIADYLFGHTLFSLSKSILTPREQEIADLLYQGYSNHKIAQLLSISESTVKTHIKHIYEELNTNKRQIRMLASLSADEK